MAFSIVIPSYNRPDLLADCLQSLIEHGPPDIQIIVVDDGSANAIISTKAALFNGVEVVRHERPQGFASAANAGIARVRFPVVQLLNDDTVVTPEWFAGPLRAFSDPTIGAVAPLVMIPPTHDGQAPRVDSAGDLYHRGGFARKRGHGRPITDDLRRECEVFGASASSAFYRTDVLRQVGAFPEQFGSYFEDVDLSWRVRRAGYRIVYRPDSTIWHRVGSSHRRGRALRERQSQNEERVYWRQVPRPWRTLPLHLGVLMGKAILRVRDGGLVPFAIGRLRAFAELPRLLRENRTRLAS